MNFLKQIFGQKKTENRNPENLGEKKLNQNDGEEL